MIVLSVTVKGRVDVKLKTISSQPSHPKTISSTSHLSWPVQLNGKRKAMTGISQLPHHDTKNKPNVQRVCGIVDV